MPLDDHALCTVCIPTYNQAEYLRAAVMSVVEQTAPVRLLVSNDASPDHTAAVLAELQSRFSFAAENHTVNRGISGNLEWLLRAANTPFVVRLDSDDLLHPEYVAKLSECLKRFPRAGYGHCAIREIDAAGATLGERRLGRVQMYQEPDAALRKAVNGYQVAANVLMFRREALADVDFGAGSAALNFVEDYDLSIRLADAGWGNVYAGDVLASYRMWAASSRPVVGRKVREVEGVTHIFTGSLTRAFQRRGWSPAPLSRRRVQLAVLNAEILDRASFAPDERAAMVKALEDLGGSRLVRYVLGRGLVSRMIRRSVVLGGGWKQGIKRLLKSLLFR